VGETCGKHGEGELFAGFWLGGLNKRIHWEELGVGGGITLRWIRLAQDRVQYRAFVNAVMKIRNQLGKCIL